MANINKNQTFQDSTTRIVDNTDNTKVAQFQCSGITTATTRTMTIPDTSSTLVVSAYNPVVATAVVGPTGQYATLGAAIAAGHTKILVTSGTLETGDIALTAAETYVIEVANGIINMGDNQFTYTAATQIKFKGQASYGGAGLCGALRFVDPSSGFLFNNATFTLSVTEFEDMILVQASTANTKRVVAAGIERYFNINFFFPNTVDCGIKTTHSNSYINNLRLFGGGGTICENALEMGGGTASNLLFTNAWTTTNEMMTVTSDDVVINGILVDVSTATPKILIGGLCSNIHSVTANLTLNVNVAGTQLSNYELNGGSVIFTNGLVSKSPGLLSRTAGIDLKITGSTNLYTVPTGKTLIITGVIVRATTATTVTVAPTVEVGKTPNFDEYIAGTLLTGLDVTNEFTDLSVATTLSVHQTFAAGEVVAINVTTGATATTLTVTVDLIGYLF